MTNFAGLDQYADLLEKIDAWEWGQAKRLSTWIKWNLHPKSVIDIGCASGLYLVPFYKTKLEVLGVDGAPTAGQKLPAEQYIRYDLRNKFIAPHLFDVCLCLETAEHIEPQYCDVFVETVSECSDVIVFSAAAPGQGGVGHYNLQPKEYWLEKFRRNGIGLHPLNAEFQVFIHNNYHQCFHPWLINNGMLLGNL